MLKIKYFAIILVLITPIVANCQIQIGVKGGYNYYYILHNDLGSDFLDHPEYFTKQNSWEGSVLVLVPVARHLNLNFELQYLSRSFNYTNDYNFDLTAYYTHYGYKIGYLGIIAQPQFIFGKKIMFYASPGFYLSNLVSAKINGSHGNRGLENGSIPLDGDAKKHFASYDFGFIQTIGVKVQVCKCLSFFIDNSYSKGFFNLAKKWDYSPYNLTFLNFFNISIEGGVTFALPERMKKIKENHIL